MADCLGGGGSSCCSCSHPCSDLALFLPPSTQEEVSSSTQLLGEHGIFVCRKKVVCVELPGSIVSSLTNNAVYVSHLDSVFPQSPYCKYPTVSGSLHSTTSNLLLFRYQNNCSPAELSERYTTGSLPTGPESYSVKCHVSQNLRV